MAKEFKIIYEGVNSFKTFLDFCCNRSGENNFFVRRTAEGKQHITYNQFRVDCVKFAVGLLKAGIEKKHIAILSDNSYEYFVMYFGTVMSGNVFVPLNPTLEIEKTVGLLDFADVSFVLITEKYASLKESISANCPKVEGYISIDGEEVSYNTLINSVSDEEVVNFESKDSVYNDDTVLLCFTSGTTGGLPKAVMLSSKNMLACVRYGTHDKVTACGEYFDLRLLPLPLYHLAALNFPIYAFMPQGTEMCLCKEVKDVFGDMMYYKPNYVIVVPAMSDMVLKLIESEVDKKGKREEFEKINIIADENGFGHNERGRYAKQFKGVVGGELISLTFAGAKSSDTVKATLRKFGIATKDGYGMTECSPMVTFEYDNLHHGSVGQVCSFNEMRIVDGVAYVKGDNVMSGYYKNAEATREVLTEDGWFCTGDLARLDEDEYVYVLGRAKSVIVLGDGENIDPEEIEVLIEKSKFVKEALVVPDEQSNNTRVGALIYPDMDEISKDGREAEVIVAEVMAQINKDLPIAKRMPRFKIMDKPFERNSMMKLLRRNYPNMSV